LTVWQILHIIICMTFEWDESKNTLNIEQHRVSFETAQKAFNDDKRIVYSDDKHSKSEKRFFLYWE